MEMERAGKAGKVRIGLGLMLSGGVLAGCSVTGGVGYFTFSTDGEEVAALRNQVARCWVPPLNADEEVQLRFDLNRSGELVGVPTVLSSGTTPEDEAVEDSAVRALVRCAPYSLPAETYESWKTITLSFDPRDLRGY
ncbi:hypothetical protein GCM10007094_30870 [Pseudovibrio japonicus]|uniref:Uncharacterized protein n=1 Tax=Pseudovibrio japonicus TaxID=366534 RepID=A0ABQ3EN95_9HYPH|nr:cell envelope integrity protein TolA [Pseudovibrio japonicus]GHB39227.1 hypothetical protein GCM10007094_30870 [Pseudovibrio japonicus]